MSEKSHSELLESLSALADGEATELELRRILKGQEESESLDRKWAEYHQIGSLLRREPAEGVDISAAISQAIAAEPKPGFVTRFTKPFGQVAVAASVAVFALFGVQQYQLAQIETAEENTAVAEAEPIQVSDPLDFAVPIGFELRPETTVVSTNPGTPDLVIELPTQQPVDERLLMQHLSERLQEHSESASEVTEDIYPMLRAPEEN